MQNRRKRFFVIKGFQLRYIVYALIFFVVASFMVWWETYATISYTFRATGLMNLKIEDFLLMVNRVVLFKMGAALLIITAAAVYLSHLVAGPLVQLRNALNAVGSGDLTVKIFFRKLDELKEIEESFNHMTDSLRNRLLECKKISEDLKEVLNKKQSGVLSESDMQRIFETVETLDRLSREIKLTVR